MSGALLKRFSLIASDCRYKIISTMKTVHRKYCLQNQVVHINTEHYTVEQLTCSSLLQDPCVLFSG